MVSRYLTPFSPTRNLPVDPFLRLQEDMYRLFDETFRGFGSVASAAGQGLATVPRVDVEENDNRICICAELPGVQPQDLDVRLEGDMLTIAGEKRQDREQKEQNFRVTERSFGRFERSVQLPFTPNSDDVRAEFTNGLLRLEVPKQTGREQSKRIEVRHGGSGNGQIGNGSNGNGNGNDGDGARAEGTEPGSNGQADASSAH
jgi:HSP20 family protein